MSSFFNPAMSSSFILMYSHLNLDNVCDMTSEEEVRTEEISEYDALITRSKIYIWFPDQKKEDPSKLRKSECEKMTFLVCNTPNNNNVLVVLLFLWSCSCQMTGFQPMDKFLYITLQSIKCMQVFLILKRDASMLCYIGSPVMHIHWQEKK